MVDVVAASPGETGSVWWNIQVLTVTLAAAVAVRASSYFGTPGVPGIDPWFHLAIIKQITISGSVPATLYSDFPSFQVLGSIVVAVAGVDARLAMFIVGSVLESGAMVFAYLMFTLFADKKTSLIAAVLVAFSVENLLWGFWVIAMSLAVPIFVAALWTFLALTIRARSNAGFRVAFLFFLGAINLIHPLASLTLIAVLSGCWLLFRLGGRAVRNYPSLTGILLGWIFLVGYWLYASGNFSVFVGLVRSSLAFDRPLNPGTTVAGSRPLVSILWDRLPYYLLELFAIPGILLGLQKRPYRICGALGVIGITMTGYALVLQQASVVAGYAGRLQVFADILLAPAGVLGLYVVGQLAHNRHAAGGLVAALVVVAAFTSLMNYGATATPILVDTGHPVTELSRAELSSLGTMRGFSNGTFISDVYSNSYIRWSLNGQTLLLGRSSAAKPSEVAIFRISALSDLALQPTYVNFDSSVQAVRFYDSGSTVGFELHS
jgi:hypothetical protein